MLGSNLQLTAYVILYKLFKECFILIIHKVVKAYSRSDKYLFNSWKLFYLFNKSDVFAVVNLKIFARLWGKAFAARADTALFLLIAGGAF